MTVIKAAAVQMSPVLYSREGTVEKVLRKIIELGRQGVHFATFPETVVPYYPYFAFVQRPFEMDPEHLKLIEQSVTIPSATTLAIGEACREVGMVVSLGVNERDGDRTPTDHLHERKEQSRSCRFDLPLDPAHGLVHGAHLGPRQAGQDG